MSSENAAEADIPELTPAECLRVAERYEPEVDYMAVFIRLWKCGAMTRSSESRSRDDEPART